ncbi:hypothetical protein LSH36_94g05047 [Paralvinella palmiformis]|uniref:U4/U6.U5 tri-snRNP-associated protein 1 n=1 Tax=Paralvinella palmiformis TaxID=53620 RepID=A0AAD9K172_9ANNE|nr:hypothetical protein LSH36_94g05047 [Paralvinella palmiformis]
MGSSKKNKEKDREHKRKRRHHSRSRSRSRERDVRIDRDRRDRRKKDEKKRKREYSPTADQQFARPPPKNSNDNRDVPESDVKESLSLSISDTNKIRAKLGLKPLDVPGSSGKDGDDSKSSKKEDVHVPPTNLSDVKKTEDLREKMLQMKEKRRINKKLGMVKTLAGTDSDDEDTLAWVLKNRKIQDEREKAAKQAKMLEEMDAEFGVGELIENEFKPQKKYTAKELAGLKVEHDQEKFGEGQTVILTLKDKGVLDEDEDTLINVNIKDEERAQRYKENKKKKLDYNPYDEEFDQYGTLKPKEILDKYDEEIHGKKIESFQLGRGGKYDAEQDKRMEEIKRELAARGEALTLPPPKLASEFYTESEMASFNKVKKKTRKLRKKQKAVTADDLLPLPGDQGQDLAKKYRKVKKEADQEEGEIMDIEAQKDGATKTEPSIPDSDFGLDDDLVQVAIEEEKAALELELVLERTRKLKQKKLVKDRGKMLADTIVKQEPEEEVTSSELQGNSGTMVLNATSEFCRTLGEIPTYGVHGAKMEEEDELMDFEKELVTQPHEETEDEHKLGWQQVEIDTRPVEIKEEDKAVLDDEPVVTDGLAAALELACKKGYLDKTLKKPVSAPKHVHLQAKNYSIEDKRYDDLDEKFRKRDRYMGGVVTDFKEKNAYKPDVKLEYIDEAGRIMNPKEAFRYKYGVLEMRVGNRQ